MKTSIKYVTLFLLLTLFSCNQQTNPNAIKINESYKITMDKLIEEVWNNQNLEMLPEVFIQDAEMHLGGLKYNLKGIPVFKKEYMEAMFQAFPDIQHGYDMLLIDGAIW